MKYFFFTFPFISSILSVGTEQIITDELRINTTLGYKTERTLSAWVASIIITVPCKTILFLVWSIHFYKELYLDEERKT